MPLVQFWLARDAAAKKRPVSNDDLSFWTMGYQYISPQKGDAVTLAADLLDRGANIDGKPKPHYTPLHRAVIMNRPDLVALLIRRGADLSRPYATGESALQIARRIMPSGVCAKLLEQASAPLQVPFTPKPAKKPQPTEVPVELDLRRDFNDRSCSRYKETQDEW